MDIFKCRKIHLDQKGFPDPYVDALTRTVLPFKCLCAQVIRQNSIPFKAQHQLPPDLIPFIQRHSERCVNTADLLPAFFPDPDEDEDDSDDESDVEELEIIVE